jgi:hypothetical protein
MKAVFFVLALAMLAGTASADTLGTASVDPTSWGAFGTPETFTSFTFTWDTPTNALSNFTLAGTGPIIQSVNTLGDSLQARASTY